MKYIKFILTVIGYYIVEGLQYIIVPIVYPIRERARDVVYDNMFIKKVFIYKHKWNVHLLIEPHPWYKYLFYYYFVWIWINDEVENDIVSSDLMKHIYMKKGTSSYVRNKILKSGVLENTNNKPYSLYGKETYNENNKITDFIVFLQLSYSDNSNFKRKYFYTNDTRKIFKITFFNKQIGWFPIKTENNEKQVYELRYR